MKILFFYPYIPYPLDRGTHHRTFNLLREVAKVHEVDFVALSEKGEGSEHAHIFEEFCQSVKIIPFEHPAWPKLFPDRILNPVPTHVQHWTLANVERELDTILSNKTYDMVHVCDIVLAQYFLKKHTDIPISVDRSRVDLQYQLMEHKRLKFTPKQKVLRYEGYAKVFFYERKVARRCSLQVVCGPDDKDFVRKYISKSVPVEVLVNGVDTEYFRAEDAKRTENPSVLFCGAMDYNPNIDALRWYFSEIHDGVKQKVPDLEVWIVGKNPVPEVQAFGNLPGVKVTGGVPDVRPYYREAWAQIVPLRIGGGTRLKIVESMCIGTPVVSTTIGAQGLPVQHGRNILLGDAPKEFGNQIVAAMKDAALRNSIAETARVTATTQLSWEGIGKRLAQTYMDLGRGSFKEMPKISPSLSRF